MSLDLGSSGIDGGLTHKPSVADTDFWISANHISTDACLSYTVDTYGGVILDSGQLPADIGVFREIMTTSLAAIQSKGFNKAYWIRVPVESIDFVPVCVKEFGFSVHHARKSYVMLMKWTHPTSPNVVPDASNHQVGVGCVILRDDGYVLLVQERSGPAAVHGAIWKIPTGLAEPDEDLADAALREAKEETGLDCLFESIICFRHSHGGSPFSGTRSDLFFACMLRLADQENTTPVLQESEILDARWVHYSELPAVTACGAGTSAVLLMELVAEAAAGKRNAVIRGCKLPAWRRANCEQWIYYPTTVADRTDVCDAP